MNVVSETLPHVIGGLVVAALLGTVSWITHRVRFRRTPKPTSITAPTAVQAGLRTYALLGTTDSLGRAMLRDTTRPVGSIVVVTIDGRVQRFQLTDAPLYGGTFAAEPLDEHQ
ncbi:hypothetical protein [Streptomyces sp. NBC_00328]|uniref:hypothetical protein n=1 Tax=Streptomyces sp. NBC_00328 TaxID=2903646 RepID=UPI002E28086E|nr:hypothetical protein [Streptomyces sp. NBC_00328]